MRDIQWRTNRAGIIILCDVTPYANDTWAWAVWDVPTYSGVAKGEATGTKASPWDQ